ncbi:hypothetical protein [Streptomyces sp. NPDC056670]|uniref:hypothetical protein n=1 Tax=Streptomyces sp. NPDC056670 TaxID=3345904 RepID=UPI0036770A3E
MKNRYMRQTGRGTQRSPEKAARHVLRLRIAGMDDRQIIAAADICPDILYRIMRGEGTIHVATEHRILAIAVPEQADRATSSHAYIPALGTHRRLRALVAEGWYAAELARRLDRDRETVTYLINGRGTGKVTMRVAAKVQALYGDLRGKRPEDHGVPAYYAERARRQSAANGWAGTGYWDEDDFDNPDFQPALSDDLKRDQLAAVRRAEIEHFDLLGLSEHEIADKLGMAYTTVRNIVLELRSGQRRVRPSEGANAPGSGLAAAA